MQPFLARVGEQLLDPRFATSRHAPPQTVTLGLYPVARKLTLISRPTEGRRLS